MNLINEIKALAVVGVFALTSQASAQQIKFDANNFVENINAQMLIASIDFEEKQIAKTLAISNSKVEQINSLIRTYDPSDFNTLDRSLIDYNQIYSLNRTISRLNRDMGKFHLASEIDEACNDFQSSEICSDKISISYKVENYYYLPPKKQLQTVTFSLPDTFTQQRQKRDEKRIAKQKQREFDRGVTYFDSHKNSSEYEFRDGNNASSEVTIACLIKLNNHLNNSGVKTPREFAKSLNSIPSDIRVCLDKSFEFPAFDLFCEFTLDNKCELIEGVSVYNPEYRDIYNTGFARFVISQKALAESVKESQFTQCLSNFTTDIEEFRKNEPAKLTQARNDYLVTSGKREKLEDELQRTNEAYWRVSEVRGKLSQRGFSNEGESAKNMRLTSENQKARENKIAKLNAQLPGVIEKEDELRLILSNADKAFDSQIQLRVNNFNAKCEGISGSEQEFLAFRSENRSKEVCIDKDIFKVSGQAPDRKLIFSEIATFTGIVNHFTERW